LFNKSETIPEPDHIRASRVGVRTCAFLSKSTVPLLACRRSYGELLFIGARTLHGCFVVRFSHHAVWANRWPPVRVTHVEVGLPG